MDVEVLVTVTVVVEVFSGRTMALAVVVWTRRIIEKILDIVNT